MRKLLASLLIISFNAYAVAPTAINGEKVTPKVYAQDVLLPNYQATKLAGLDTRIETGNTNLLINPSFEHGTPSTGWTLTNATSAVTLIDFTDGKKGLTVTPTVAGGGIKQVSTLYAAKIIGGQGVAQISVKTAGSDVKVCPLINGSRPTDVAKFCAAVPVSSTTIVFPEAIVPFILDGTSNGIEIYSTNTTAFTIDEAFVGKADPFASNSNVSQWTSYTPTLTGFGTATAIEFQYRQVGGNYEIRGKFTAGTVTATEARVSLPNSSTSAGTGIIPSLQQVGSGNYTAASASTAAVLIEPSVTYITFGVQSIGAAGIAKVNGNGILNNGQSLSFFASVPIAGLEQAGKVYSQASQDYAYTNAGAITIGATTTAPTKGTIVTDRIMASRKGQRLNAEYQYEQSSVGTAGSGDYLYSLPTVSGVQLQFDSSVVGFYTGVAPTNQAGLGRALVGYGKAYGDTGFTYNVQLIAYDSTRFRALISYGNTGNRFVDNVVWHLGLSTSSYNFKLDAPIQGWQDYGVIVGSFAGLEKCANDYECTDTFSAIITTGTGVVSNYNTANPWITCTAANPSVCTFASGLKDGTSNLSSPMNCNGTTVGTTTAVSSVLGATSSGFSINSTLTTTGTTTNASIHVNCVKGSQDYKPKTAKIASSVGVPTVPGLAGTNLAVDTFSVSYGATINTECATINTACAYLDQIGSGASGVVHGATTGLYNLNFNKTYIKVKCVGNFFSSTTGNSNVGGTSNLMQCSNCSTIQFTNNLTSNGVVTNTFGIIDCKGTYQ